MFDGWMIEGAETEKRDNIFQLKEVKVISYAFHIRKLELIFLF